MRTNDEVSKRKAEIKFQWEAYKANPFSLTAGDLKILKEQAKKYGVKLV